MTIGAGSAPPSAIPSGRAHANTKLLAGESKLARNSIDA